MCCPPSGQGQPGMIVSHEGHEVDITLSSQGPLGQHPSRSQVPPGLSWDTWPGRNLIGAPTIVPGNLALSAQQAGAELLPGR
jgi:hypothetical protein